MQLDHDMHVHSTYSDGRHSLEHIIAVAQAQGLRRMGLVDHVCRETPWVATYIGHIERLQRETTVELVIGVQTKFLDDNGTLELPDNLHGIQRVVVADHQLPIEGSLLTPQQVRARVAEQTLSIPKVIDAQISVYERCIERYENLQLAHPFSLLARANIPEWWIPLVRLRRFAYLLAKAGTVVEVSERWRCPGSRSVHIFQQAGVEVVASSNAQHAKAIGRYDYVRRVSSMGEG